MRWWRCPGRRGRSGRCRQAVASRARWNPRTGIHEGPLCRPCVAAARQSAAGRSALAQSPGSDRRLLATLAGDPNPRVRDLVARRLDADAPLAPELQWPTSLYATDRDRWPIAPLPAAALAAVGIAAGLAVSAEQLGRTDGSDAVAGIVDVSAASTTDVTPSTYVASTARSVPSSPTTQPAPTTITTATVVTTTSIVPQVTTTSTAAPTVPVAVAPPLTTTRRQVTTTVPPETDPSPRPQAPSMPQPTTNAEPPATTPVITASTPAPEPPVPVASLTVQHVNQTDVPGEAGTTCIVSALVSGGIPYAVFDPDGVEHGAVGATSILGPPGVWRLIADVPIDASVQSNIGGGGCL